MTQEGGTQINITCFSSYPTRDVVWPPPGSPRSGVSPPCGEMDFCEIHPFVGSLHRRPHLRIWREFLWVFCSMKYPKIAILEATFALNTHYKITHTFRVNYTHFWNSFFTRTYISPLPQINSPGTLHTFQELFNLLSLLIRFCGILNFHGELYFRLPSQND